MMYDFFDGEWRKVSAEWLNGVKLDGLKEVYRDVNNHIRCIYKNGDEVYYVNKWGTWGFPVVIR